MAYAKGKKRLSIDLDSDVYRSLSEYVDHSKKTGLTKGFFINQVIKNISQLDPTVANELSKFCYKNYRKHAKISFELPDDEVEKQENELTISKQYEQLYVMFNGFSCKSILNREIVDMERYDMKSGYAIIPADWIVLNKDEAKDCTNLFVLEVNNPGDLVIPHFCYFIEEWNMNSSEKETFLKKVRKECPDFIKAEANEFVPMYGKEDENGNRELLNSEEYLKKPDIGIFKIHDAGNPLENYPYSAMIFRKE